MSNDGKKWAIRYRVYLYTIHSVSNSIKFKNPSRVISIYPLAENRGISFAMTMKSNAQTHTVFMYVGGLCDDISSATRSKTLLQFDSDRISHTTRDFSKLM